MPSTMLAKPQWCQSRIVITILMICECLPGTKFYCGTLISFSQQLFEVSAIIIPTLQLKTLTSEVNDLSQVTPLVSGGSKELNPV